MLIARGALAGALTGLSAAALAVVVISFAAPAFLWPVAAATLALLLAGLASGAVLGAIGALLTPRAPERGATRAAAAVWGAALGAIVTAALVPAPTAGPMLAGLLAGALLGLVLGAPLGGLAVRDGDRRPLAPRAAVAASVALACIAAALQAVPSGAAAGRLVVVGLDGGTWRVLGPLVERGEMPATARLLREGASGVLWSMEPSSSSVLWTTIATGRRPEEHGIHDFYGTQNEQLRAVRFWEIASQAGERVGIFQWLVTWPPDPLPGFVVPGWLARDATTHPETLGFVKELEVRLQRRERPDASTALAIGAGAFVSGLTFGSVVRAARDGAEAWRIGSERAWYRAGKLGQLGLHGDVFLDRYRRDGPAVAAVVFYGSDALSHMYWKFHEPERYPDVTPEDVRLYGETIRDYYRRFDAFLGRLLDVVGPDTTVLVVSDHGFQAAQDQTLTVRTAPLLELAGARDAFTAHAINRQVYLTHRTPGTPEAEADVARVAATLAGLKAGARPLLDVEPTAGERVTVELHYDVRYEPDDAAIEGGARPMRLGDLLTRIHWSGSHADDGILLARGPNVRRGERGVSAHILDVAPTLLALLGYPVAADMDGRVLQELFVEPLDVTTVASHDAAIPGRRARRAPDAIVEERLRALGYVR